MKKSRFTESQILAILTEGGSGIPVAEVCRKPAPGMLQLRHYVGATRGIGRAFLTGWDNEGSPGCDMDVGVMGSELALESPADCVTHLLHG